MVLVFSLAPLLPPLTDPTLSVHHRTASPLLATSLETRPCPASSRLCPLGSPCQATTPDDDIRNTTLALPFICGWGTLSCARPLFHTAPPPRSQHRTPHRAQHDAPLLLLPSPLPPSIANACRLRRLPRLPGQQAVWPAPVLLAQRPSVERLCNLSFVCRSCCALQAGHPALPQRASRPLIPQQVSCLCCGAPHRHLTDSPPIPSRFLLFDAAHVQPPPRPCVEKARSMPPGTTLSGE